MAAASARRAVELQIAFESAELVFLWKPGEGVIAGDAGEGDGSFDQTSDGFRREVGGGGAGDLLAKKNSKTDGAGARLLEGLDLAEADASGELVALVDDGLGVGGSGFEGSGEDVLGELMQVGFGFSGHLRLRALPFDLLQNLLFIGLRLGPIVQDLPSKRFMAKLFKIHHFVRVQFCSLLLLL